MSILKRCVAIINHRSGHRNSFHSYTDTLKQYMDHAGIVHHDIHIPNDDVAEYLRRTLPNAEALILCGGDGTVNSTINLLAAMTASGTVTSLLNTTPLLLVPTGLRNSIATSLGVGTAERAVSSLVIGHTVRVPLWAVYLRPPPSLTTPSCASSSSPSPSLVHYMCSYVAIGTYAKIVWRQEKWKEAQEDYVSLPGLFGTMTATSLYTAVEHASPHCTAELITSKRDSRCFSEFLESDNTKVVSNIKDDAASSFNPSRCRLGPLRMLVAAQMPQLQAGYSLTPVATYHQHSLTVTTATDGATRMRMWHLLHRESREGYILPEDGIAMQEGVQGLRIEFPPLSSGDGSTDLQSSTGKSAVVNTGDTSDEDAALMVLDGECVRVPHGSTVTVAPTEHTALFIVS